MSCPQFELPLGEGNRGLITSGAARYCPLSYFENSHRCEPSQKITGISTELCRLTSVFTNLYFRKFPLPGLLNVSLFFCGVFYFLCTTGWAILLCFHCPHCPMNSLFLLWFLDCCISCTIRMPQFLHNVNHCLYIHRREWGGPAFEQLTTLFCPLKMASPILSEPFGTVGKALSEAEVWMPSLSVCFFSGWKHLLWKC